MKDFFRKNLGLKLISVILAVLLELYFYSEGNSIEATILIDAKLRNQPTSMMVVSPAGAERGITIKARVRGPSTLVREMENRANTVNIVLPSPIPETFRTGVDVSQLRLETGVHIVDLEPEEISFEFERVVRKELLVVVNRQGTPAVGYEATDIRVSPETVFARGPSSELEAVGIIETQPVDIAGLKKTKRIDAPLKEVGKLTNLGINVVSVEVSIEARRITKTFESVPVRVTTAANFKGIVEPSAVSVTLVGPEPNFKDIEAGQLDLWVDARSISSGEYQVPVNVKSPEGLELVDTRPASVSVSVVAANGGK